MGFLGRSSRRRLVGTDSETRSVVLGRKAGPPSRLVKGMQSLWTTKAAIGMAIIDEFLSIRPVYVKAQGLFVWAIGPIAIIDKRS